MTLNEYICEGDNPDLTDERKLCSFPTRAMTAAVYTKENYFEKIRKFKDLIARTPELQDNKPFGYMTYVEKLENGYRKEYEMMRRLSSTLGDLSPEDEFLFRTTVQGVYAMPFRLHQGMFIPAIKNLGDDDQAAKWLPLAENLAIIGTYAQTELGHGTFLRELETTADFVQATDEFVLHSPSLTSIKWWPGNMAKTATHAIVPATLKIKGKSYGLHNFLVQLRDIKTHQPLRGIEVGSIGPKLGLDNVDNGYLKLSHVRIPRTQLLMRHAKVTREGNYIRSPHDKLNYSTMIVVRSGIPTYVGKILGMAVTIAVRYSSVRRQGELKPGEPEVKVLDYQTQQYRLLPHLARAYAMLAAGEKALDFGQRVLEEVSKGKVDGVADLHALTSGLKALCSRWGVEGVEQCRQACGGHGFSLASNISVLHGLCSAISTYEGENLVMLLQVGRYLIKAAADARFCKRHSEMTDYMTREQLSRANGVPINKNRLLELLEEGTKARVFFAFDRLKELEKTKEKHAAWNENSVEINKAARAHVRLLIAKAFFSKVNDVQEGRVKAVLDDLLELFLCYEIVQSSKYLFEVNVLDSSELKRVRELLYKKLSDIRPNAVSLVDALDFDDWELRSVLGRRDGRVYEGLVDFAKQCPLNEHDILSTFTKIRSCEERERVETMDYSMDEDSRDTADTGYSSDHDAHVDFSVLSDSGSPDQRVDYSLPVVERPKVASTTFASISAQTLAQLMLHYGDEEFQRRFFLIDCRYPYEYEGGHVKGAVNNHETAAIGRLFYPDCPMQAAEIRQRIPIFYCEFSQQRGPAMADALRRTDRTRNYTKYPNLDFKEMYVLDMGYQNFYHVATTNSLTSLLIPPGYVPMLHPEYTEKLRSFNHHHSKVRRAKSQAARGRSLRVLSENVLTETVAVKLAFKEGDTSPEETMNSSRPHDGSSPLSSRVFYRSQSYTSHSTYASQEEDISMLLEHLSESSNDD